MSLDKSEEKIRSLFDQIAPRYDFINHLLSCGIDRSWRKKTAKIVLDMLREPISQAVPFLDVCCGTGDLSIALYREYLKRTRKSRLSGTETTSENASKILTGIDFSPKMLEIGRKKIAKIGATEDIELLEGDALELPFDADAFSVVSVAFGLRNMEDTDRGISEMVRVCKPGGVVAILDFGLPSKPVISSVYNFFLRRILPIIGQRISKNQDGAYKYFSESVVQFEKGEALTLRLKRWGLEEVRFQEMNFGTVILYTGRK
ncbi:MAG: bifunctional demethylmenaquinone methyltransferase/2-methoxy-6-polyprenyl-1,4-benzoquinol methylase UbiE [Thermoguttaceae bacterium]